MTDQPIQQGGNSPVLYKHLMIDIETLAVHTSNSFILSIGLLPFTMNDIGIEFGKPVIALPDPYEQFAKGRKVDPSTHEFWMNQSPEARRHWADANYGNKDGEPIPMRGPASQITAILQDVWHNIAAGGNVWANGIVFDIGNLENLVGMNVPWPYNAARDLRTVARPPFKKLRQRSGDVNSSYHDPIADCLNQCWELWEYWPEGAF